MATSLPQLSSILSIPHEGNLRPRKRRRKAEAPRDANAVEVLPEEMVSQLLNRSTAMILQSIGFASATAGVQERMRKLVDDCVARLIILFRAHAYIKFADYFQMVQTVGLFALAQRRTRPTVLDFEEMLRHNHISLSGLEDELMRMPSKTPSVILPTPSPPPPPDPDLAELLGPELDGSRDQRCHLYEHLPPFPSRHTYQETPVFSERPTDPRLIREKATAESRLAEQALRKLLAVSATRKDVVQDCEQKLGTKRKERHHQWKKAFEGLHQAKGRNKMNGHPEVESLSSIMNDPLPSIPDKKQDEDGYLEVVVNSDSQFWRKGKGATKRTQSA